MIKAEESTTGKVLKSQIDKNHWEYERGNY